MSNWSQLPHDLLIEIAQHIKKIKDFFVFGVVCKTWSKVGKKEYFNGLWLWPGIPYLLLPAKDDDNDVREFYSLVDCDIVASVSIYKFKTRQCHESLGWLLAIEEDGSMSLLNPFSSVEIPVPHQSTFSEQERGYPINAFDFVFKFVLSASPSETSSDFIVMIICGHPIVLAFWRPGDESWNIIRNRWKPYADVMYHDGNFYTIDYGGIVSVFTLPKNNRPPEYRTRATHLKLSGYAYHSVYILKTSLSLIIITRRKPLFDSNNVRMSGGPRKFQVYEVDMSTSTCVEIYDIGSMAIFVGHNTTFAIDVNTSRLSEKIKGNRIYFSDDGWLSFRMQDISKDMGVFNLETGTFESFYGGEVIPTYICHSVWITPRF